MAVLSKPSNSVRDWYSSDVYKIEPDKTSEFGNSKNQFRFILKLDLGVVTLVSNTYTEFSDGTFSTTEGSITIPLEFIDILHDDIYDTMKDFVS